VPCHKIYAWIGSNSIRRTEEKYKNVIGIGAFARSDLWRSEGRARRSRFGQTPAPLEWEDRLQCRRHQIGRRVRRQIVDDQWQVGAGDEQFEVIASVSAWNNRAG
jgi:hypothetical protein